jgi:hypothetical protein
MAKENMAGTPWCPLIIYYASNLFIAPFLSQTKHNPIGVIE